MWLVEIKRDGIGIFFIFCLEISAIRRTTGNVLSKIGYLLSLSILPRIGVSPMFVETLIFAASLQALSADDQYKEISAFVNAAQVPNKERLYPLLAATGTDASVAELEKIGDDAAIEALGKSTIEEAS